MKNYFKLFACCIPIKGASLSIICDTQRNKFHYIPNELFNILEEDKIDIKKLLTKYSLEEQETLEEYFDFFIEEEYGFLTDTPESFPKIDTNFIIPHQINDAIVDFSSSSEHDFAKIYTALNELGCRHLEMRFFDDYSLEKLCSSILPNFKDTRIRGVILYLKYSEKLTEQFIYQETTQKYPVIIDVIIHSAPFHRRSEEIKFLNILYVKEAINSEKHCGIIGIEYFSINSSTIFESLKYNSCLNKKLAIDSNGFIKNCPSLQSHYGSHREKSIQEIVKTDKFQEIWNVTKDSIDTCKDCQFRYICTDCRAYTESPSNSYSKPLKCGYDPYSNVWEEWSTNPLKQRAIEFYDMTDLLKP